MTANCVIAVTSENEQLHHYEKGTAEQRDPLKSAAFRPKSTVPKGRLNRPMPQGYSPARGSERAQQFREEHAMMNTGITLPETPSVLCGGRSGAHTMLEADPDRFAANEEPCLDDLLTDPMTVSLMTSDGVHRDSVAALLRDARARLTR
jgi:hypothetical protein